MEATGVELSPEKIEMANRIRAFRSLGNVKFLCSPSGSELPHGIGHFVSSCLALSTNICSRTSEGRDAAAVVRIETGRDDFHQSDTVPVLSHGDP